MIGAAIVPITWGAGRFKPRKCWKTPDGRRHNSVDLNDTEYEEYCISYLHGDEVYWHRTLKMNVEWKVKANALYYAGDNGSSVGSDAYRANSSDSGNTSDAETDTDTDQERT